MGVLLISVCFIVTTTTAPVLPGDSPPKPYAFQYGVKDGRANLNFKAKEQQDNKGNVQGIFVIALPDGRIQTTKYLADHENGFRAEVTYDGEATYPDPLKKYKE